MIYFLENGHKEVKIGYTKNKNTLITRVGNLQIGSATPLKLIALYKGDKVDEKRLHSEYVRQHIGGEWFRYSSDMANRPNNLLDGNCGEGLLILLDLKIREAQKQQQIKAATHK